MQKVFTIHEPSSLYQHIRCGMCFNVFENAQHFFYTIHLSLTDIIMIAIIIVFIITMNWPVCNTCGCLAVGAHVRPFIRSISILSVCFVCMRVCVCVACVSKVGADIYRNNTHSYSCVKVWNAYMTLFYAPKSHWNYFNVALLYWAWHSSSKSCVHMQYLNIIWKEYEN